MLWHRINSIFLIIWLKYTSDLSVVSDNLSQYLTDISPSPTLSVYCHVGEVLTDEWVGDVCPVDAVLQLELVVGLDVEQEVLVEPDASDQVSPVGALQSAAAVDMLHEENEDEGYEETTNSLRTPFTS